MKPLHLTLTLLGVTLASHHSLLAQGCVAVRGGSCAGSLHGLGTDPETAHFAAGDWQFSLGYRWLHSDRHFVGATEQDHRQDLNTEVINDSHFWDLGIQYGITPKLSLGLVVPFVYSDRSSLYEFGGVNGRRHSSAGGLGDVRLLAYWWLWNPEPSLKGNILFGLGPKFPTGDYRAKDTFLNAAGRPVEGYVDQSIQPGDGGWGFMAEIFAYRELVQGLSAYAQGAYLFNPENINGTPTTTGVARRNPYEQVMSIPDQYLGRVGLNHAFWPEAGFSGSLGVRMEGVPVRDAIGKDDGFRRPGYAVSVEPGITWMKYNWTVAVTTPVAVFRNRERSVADMRWSRDSGIYRHGDAAFADYTLNATIAYKF